MQRTQMTMGTVRRLIKDGTYVVDVETCEVTGPKGPVNPYTDDVGRKWIRLYCNGERKGIGLSKLVWMVGTGCMIPKGFEVHHRNKDVSDNRFSNLICLHKIDHRKLHQDDDEETPF